MKAIDDWIVSFDSLDWFSFLINVVLFQFNEIVHIIFIYIGELVLVKERVLLRFKVLPYLLRRLPLD